MGCAYNTGVSGEAKNFGTLTKIKAQEYRQLQASEAGRAQLSANLLQAAPPASENKKAKGNAIFEIVKKQVCAIIIYHCYVGI